jgi:LysM repeat protein
MNRNLLNEINQMKFMFGYKPGKVLSEQDEQMPTPTPTPMDTPTPTPTPMDAEWVKIAQWLEKNLDGKRVDMDDMGHFFVYMGINAKRNVPYLFITDGDKIYEMKVSESEIKDIERIKKRFENNKDRFEIFSNLDFEDFHSTYRNLFKNITYLQNTYPELAKELSRFNEPEEPKFDIGTALSIYQVKPGDNLTKISKEMGVSVDEILKQNPHIKDKNKIFPGDKIQIEK